MSDWRKSSYSQSTGGQCVECGTGLGSVLVRDTTDRSGAVLSLAPSTWTAFLATIR